MWGVKRDVGWGVGGQKGCRVAWGVKRDVGWGGQKGCRVGGGQKGCRVGCGGSKGM